MSDRKVTVEYFHGAERTPENIKCITTTENLSSQEVLDKYRNILSEQEIKLLEGHVNRKV